MSSDDAYMSFLDKANADLNAGRAPQQGSSTARTETVDANVKVPKPLQSVDACYISDADEPFEPVALKWEGASKGDWPSPGTFFFLLYLFRPFPTFWTPSLLLWRSGGVRWALDGVQG